MKITIDPRDACNREYLERNLASGVMFLYRGDLYFLTHISKWMTNTLVAYAINISKGKFEAQEAQIPYGEIKIVTELTVKC